MSLAGFHSTRLRREGAASGLSSRRDRARATRAGRGPGSR